MIIFVAKYNDVLLEDKRKQVANKLAGGSLETG
jgi:hypothetical protein